ncbi:MAG: HEAT repeat domain-containing protein [Acidimicrobiales bacterium]
MSGSSGGQERRQGQLGGGAANPQPATNPRPTGGAGRRRRAVLAGHAGDVAAATALLADHDAAVRGAAYGALARMGRLDAVVLREALGDHDASVRRRACEEAGRALGHAEDGDSGPLPPVAELVAALEGALGDAEDAVVEAAAWAIGEAGASGASALEALVAVAGGHRAPLCREAAVAALGAIGDEGGLDAVIGALDDKPAIRRRAAVALAAFDGERVEEALRRCLEDRDWQVRQAAEELLRPE